VREVDRLRIEDNFGGFIETGALGRFKTRLAVRNAVTQRSFRERQFFQPGRSGVLGQTEERQQRSPLFMTLAMSGSFQRRASTSQYARHDGTRNPTCTR